MKEKTITELKKSIGRRKSTIAEIDDQIEMLTVMKNNQKIHLKRERKEFKRSEY